MLGITMNKTKIWTKIIELTAILNFERGKDQMNPNVSFDKTSGRILRTYPEKIRQLKRSLI
jgi:hypothetical protein